MVCSETESRLVPVDGNVIELDRSPRPVASNPEAVEKVARPRRAAGRRRFGHALRPRVAEPAVSASVGTFEIWTAKTRGRVALSLVGKMDAPASELFSQYLSALVQEGVRSVLVDLAATQITDGAGLLALQAGRMAVEANRGELILKSPRADTLQAIARFGLSSSFLIS